ncbi:hypothetical protein ACIBG7_06145 [Nonomuraea sp. NPDC050328]|uniref:hypothetical protein n=1 Tax=Nonomuraea sp. NPDC050328 TaxID=3364361 RepID=UPI00379E3454
MVGNAEGLTPARLRTPPCRLTNQLATTASRVIGQALSGTGSRPYHYALLGRRPGIGRSVAGVQVVLLEPLTVSERERFVELLVRLNQAQRPNNWT